MEQKDLTKDLRDIWTPKEKRFHEKSAERQRQTNQRHQRFGSFQGPTYGAERFERYLKAKGEAISRKKCWKTEPNESPEGPKIAKIWQKRGCWAKILAKNRRFHEKQKTVSNDAERRPSIWKKIAYLEEPVEVLRSDEDWFDVIFCSVSMYRYDFWRFGQI